MIRRPTILVLASALVGCQITPVGKSEFSCTQSAERGTPCASMLEVYYGDRDDETARSHLPLPSATSDGPLLSQPIVLRVWIAPWEDASGNLRWPGYVFSELRPQRWRVGAREIEQGAKRLTPLTGHAGQPIDSSPQRER